jgi:cytochrome b pre-mRNA-processing protein 3
LILQRLFSRKPNSIAVLYDAIVAAARQPHFYENGGVPDTLDGRFDLIVLHLFLVLERMEAETEGSRQRLIDYFFLDMDRSLREIGVGDLSVGKKVRKMAEAFYGRITTYTKAIEQGEAALVEALQRNVFAGESNSAALGLARWAIAARAKLAAQPLADVLKARLEFA